MNKDFLIKLTNELYQLTLLFPKKEPLRYKMRELADDILAKCLTSEVKHNPVLEELEILDGFFEVAKDQEWVKLEEILNLQGEYSKLKGELKSLCAAESPGDEEFRDKELEVKSLEEIAREELQEEPSEELPPESIPLETVKVPISERQRKILDILKEKGRAQVWEIKQVFPDISKRTLRRDFENLFKRGIIERMGERNNTFYQLS